MSVALLLLSVAVVFALLVLCSRFRSAMPAPKIASKIPVKSALPQPSKTGRTVWQKKPDKFVAEERPEIELRLESNPPVVKRAVSKEKLSRTDSSGRDKKTDPKNGDKLRTIPARNVNTGDKTKRPVDNSRSARTNPDTNASAAKPAASKPKVGVLGKFDDSENKVCSNRRNEIGQCDVSSTVMETQQARPTPALLPRVMCKNLPGAGTNNIAIAQSTNQMPDPASLESGNRVSVCSDVLRTDPQLNMKMPVVQVEQFDNKSIPVIVSSYLMFNGKHKIRPGGNFSKEPKEVTLRSESLPNTFNCLTVVSRIEKSYGLFFGAFCVNTGRKISDHRFRTECQVFFRAGVLPRLESQRDEKLADRVVHFQSHCRGFLARKRFAKRKVEQLAVRCIQRNVRKFLSVRDWPWWRLLVRVMPLLNVHRTEQELRSKTEELDNLKSKFEKLEQEKSILKLETSKLEAKIPNEIHNKAD